MTIDEVKEKYVQAGIPEALLSGETAEEIEAQGKALLAFHRDSAKSTRDQFAEWVSARLGYDPPTPPEPPRQDAYPITMDGGEGPGEFTTSTRDRFAEWASDKLAFDPRKGW